MIKVMNSHVPNCMYARGLIKFVTLQITFLSPVSVDDYTSEDWKKFEAAVNALKSNVLDDTIELEPSAIGQFIQTGYARSQSTPNFTEIDELGPYLAQEYTTPGEPNMPHSFDQAHARQSGDVSPNTQRLQTAHISTLQRGAVQGYNGEELTTDWVAGLPNIRRKRALTEPTPTINIEFLEFNRPTVKTLPRQTRLSTPERALIVDPKRRIVKKKSMSPRQLSISEDLELDISVTDRKRK